MFAKANRDKFHFTASNCFSVRIGQKIGEETDLADLVASEISAMDAAIEEVGCFADDSIGSGFCKTCPNDISMRNYAKGHVII